MSRRCPLFAIFGPLILASATYADTIVLTNHDHLTGTIEQITPAQIVITTPYAQHLSIARNQVESFTTDQIRTAAPAATLPAATANTTAPATLPLAAAKPAVPATMPEQLSLFGPHWKNQFALGLVNTTGNTEETQLATGLDFHYFNKPHDLTLKFNVLYATVNGVVNQSVAAGDFVYRADLPALTPHDRWYFFAENHELYDGIKGISLRSINALGPGYYIWKGQKLTADIRGGPGFTYERYFNDATHTDANILVGLRALYQFSPRLSLAQDTVATTAMTEDSRMQLTSKTDLNLKLPELQRGMGLKFSFIDDYDNSSAQNQRQNNDTRVVVSLTLDF